MNATNAGMVGMRGDEIDHVTARFTGILVFVCYYVDDDDGGVSMRATNVCLSRLG